MINVKRCWLVLLSVLALSTWAGSVVADGPLDPLQIPAVTNRLQFKREQAFIRSRVYPLGYIPQGARLTAHKRAAEIQNAQLQNFIKSGAGSPPTTTNRWVNIGPAPIEAGQVAPPQPVSGRVESIAVDPNNPSHWLIGAAQGGVWQTEDAGTTWTPLTDNQASLAMGAIAFGGTNSGIIYAGTGEAANSADSYAGEGLLKSTDGGVTWQLLASSTFAQSSFGSIRVSPANPNVLMAATAGGIAGREGAPPPFAITTGVFKSTDGGQTWSRKLTGDSFDLEVDPTSNFTNQYAGLGLAFGSPANGVYRSTNSGDAWTLITGPWSPNTAGVGRIQLAIAPSAPATVYVSIQDASFTNFGGSLGVWETTNGWDPTPTWTQLPAIPTTGTQFDYDHVLLVDQTNPSILYLGETPLWKWNGTTWTAIGGNYDQNVQGIKIHPDQHALAWAGQGTLIVGNDGGMWKSSDGGNTFANLNTTLAITQFYEGSVHPTNPNFIMGGSQDNGTELRTNSNAWTLIFDGDGQANAISSGRPDTDWAVSSQGLNIFQTTDGGNTFNFGAAGIDISTAPFTGLFEKAPTNDDLFIAGTDALWKCTNFFSSSSPSWVQNSPHQGSDITALGFAASDGSANTYAYATFKGAVHITADGGNTWADITGTLPGRFVNGLAFDPTNPNILYVVLGGFNQGTFKPGHIFATTNALASTPAWTDISTPVDIPHNAIVVDPANPATIYVGTDIGVWKSIDSGNSWNQVGNPQTGLPNVAVFKLKINRVTNQLVAFTHGRSAFALSLAVAHTTGVNLSLSMKAIPSPVLLGNNLTYTMTVVNNGSVTATNVIVTQTLPLTVQYVSGISSQGSVTQFGNTVNGNVGNLIVGASAKITVVVTPTTAGTILSTATASSSVADSDPSDNSATVQTRVQPPTADLALGLAAAPNPAFDGGLLTFTVSVTNNGPLTATGVTLSNSLPNNVSFVSAGSSQGNFFNTGSNILFSLGSLGNGAVATATLTVSPGQVGNVTASASVIANQVDPLPENNSATIVAQVDPAADVSLAMVAVPSSVIVGSNVTYTLTVLNSGPNPATGLILKDTLPAGVALVSASPSQGTASINGNVITGDLGTLTNGTGASVSIVVSTSPYSNSVPVVITNTASITGNEADPNPLNNTASAVVSVDHPRVNVVAAGATLTMEGFVPPDGAIDPGETVTVSFGLQNIGNIDSLSNVVATLLPTGGVVSPGGPQSYGVLSAAGLPVSRSFTFTAAASISGVLVATLQLQDGTNNLGTAQFTFNLPTVNAFANLTNIAIPDPIYPSQSGPASPYPSIINVSGLTGLLGKVAVVLTNVNHTFPDDIDMVLVGPSGQKVLLMSHAGGGNAITNVSLTFDEGAVGELPQTTQILSGTYLPSPYGSVTFTNGPAAPFGTNLSDFNQTSPNGVWSLYVEDSTPGDAGIAIGGWSLLLTTVQPVNQIADLGLSGSASPNPVLVAGNLTYSFVITNNGPNQATNVTFADSLPNSVNFVSATSSQGTVSLQSGNLVAGNLGSLAAGAGMTVSVVVSPGAPGTITNTATVAASQSDLNPANNSASVVTSVNNTVADLALTLSGPTNAMVTSNLTYTITVTNAGPNSALGAGVTDLLPAGVGFVSAVSSQGTFTVGSGTVAFNLGNIPAGAGASISLVATSSVVGLITNSASVGENSFDPNLANNSASAVAAITQLGPNIFAAGSSLLSESGPVNDAIDPGETVTVSLKLANNGALDTVNLVATLLPGGGVTSPSGPQTYGALIHGGPAVAAPFSFTANGTNNGFVVATLQLQDGPDNLGSVTFVYNLPGAGAFASSQYIVIPDSGPATPYPATINVSGMTGLVSKVTATISNLNHTFPSDVRILLVNPVGQDTILMSSTGGSSSVTNVTLTFDDAAAFSLPGSSQLNFITVPGQIVSGTFKPTDFGPGVSFPLPAPAVPYVASLASLNGVNPNGAWALYVLDDSPGDSGNIAGGWSLNIATLSPVNAALSGQLRLDPAAVQSNGAFTLTLTGQPGKSYVIQASTDLVSWTSVVTNATSFGGTLQFTDTNVVSFPYRFYRAHSFP